MGSTISVRLSADLAEWLRSTARSSGVPQGKIVRDQLEKAREAGQPSFMKLAGKVTGPANLSQRKGYSRT